ncbi:hypothetical protein LCGC14_2630130, partial [marine sediment metagenome]
MTWITFSGMQVQHDLMAGPVTRGLCSGHRKCGCAVNSLGIQWLYKTMDSQEMSVRRIVFIKTGAAIRESPLRALRPGEVLVRARCSLVSVGTETTLYLSSRWGLDPDAGAREDQWDFEDYGSGERWDMERNRGFPGYALAGDVIAVGQKVDDFVKGDRVIALHHHADLAIFPDTHGPLRSETKKTVYRLYHQGESVESLARRFCRTKASIYRIISEMRAHEMLELPLDYMPNELFAHVRSQKREKTVTGPMPSNDQSARKARLPSGLPPYLASLYDVPLLTREQEAHLFRKMNYLKYKATQLREKLDPTRPKSSLMDQIERVYDEAVATKNRIVRANLRLVVSIAKRHVGAPEDFFELVSDGNMSLIRAVEKFDFSRGNKFSTYSSWAIMKNYAKSIPEESYQLENFVTGTQELMEGTGQARNLGDTKEERLPGLRAELHRFVNK